MSSKHCKKWWCVVGKWFFDRWKRVGVTVFLWMNLVLKVSLHQYWYSFLLFEAVLQWKCKNFPPFPSTMHTWIWHCSPFKTCYRSLNEVWVAKTKAVTQKKIRSSRKEREVHKFLLILFRLNGDKNVFFCLSSHTYKPTNFPAHFACVLYDDDTFPMSFMWKAKQKEESKKNSLPSATCQSL